MKKVFRRVNRQLSMRRVSVRPHIAWYLRWSMMLPFLLGGAALVWFAYDSGLEFAGFHRGETQRELSELNARLVRLTDENARQGRQLAQFQQQIRMEQGRGQETARQLQGLSEENARLQQDLGFFQNLTAENGRDGELTIHRLTLERDKLPGEYRVRMLLVQHGQRVKEFTGGYQLVATVLQNGRRTNRLFPSEQSGLAQFKLNFKYYQRLEQDLRLSPDSQMQSIQVRLFEQGEREPKVRQSVNLI